MENLDSLRNIKHVYFSVDVSNSNISSFQGLSGLVSVGYDFFIINNYKIKNLDGLYNLLYVGGDLIINGCSELESLSGLRSLIKIDRLSIFNNSKLVSLKGLEGIDTLKSCIINGNEYPVIMVRKYEKGILIWMNTGDQKISQCNAISRLDANFIKLLLNSIIHASEIKSYAYPEC